MELNLFDLVYTDYNSKLITVFMILCNNLHTDTDANKVYPAIFNKVKALRHVLLKSN